MAIGVSEEDRLAAVLVFRGLLAKAHTRLLIIEFVVFDRTVSPAVYLEFWRAVVGTVFVVQDGFNALLVAGIAFFQRHWRRVRNGNKGSACQEK